MVGGVLGYDLVSFYDLGRGWVSLVCAVRP